MEGTEWAAFHWGSAPGAVVRAGWRVAAHGGEVGALVLARGSKGNAWNGDMWSDWDKAVALLAARSTIRVVRGSTRH
jgi:enoyl-CoA hydratase/carnithine racemase